MAEKRMFSKQIIDSDVFLDMSLSTQALYFHLCMRADDDGFINNPKRIQRLIGSSDDELKLLIAKKFVIPFESGVCVIKHWKIHNYIQKDRYKPTAYQEEKSQLSLKENKSYSLVDTTCIQPVYNSCTSCTPRLDKNRIDKNRIDKNNIKKEKRKVNTEFDELISNYSKDKKLCEAIYEFIKHRKTIKATMTTLALKKTLNKLDTFTENNDEKIDILNQSVMNGWKGIFPIKGYFTEGDSRKKAEDEIKERIARGEDPF